MNALPNIKRVMQDIRSLQRLWPFLREQKMLLLAAVILVPVISLFQMSLPIILKYAIDEGIQKGAYDAISMGAALYFTAVVGEYLSRAGQTVLTSLAVHRMINKARMALIRHVLRLSPSYHDRSMSGALVTRATSDFDNLSESLNMGVLTSIVDFAILGGAIAGLLWLNWKLALVAILILPFVAVIVTNFSRGLKKSMMAARVKIAALNAFAQECLYGSTTVKLLTAERAGTRKFDKLAIEYRDVQMKSVILDASLFAILDGIAAITIGVVLWYAVTHVGGPNEALSAGLMVAFVQYLQNIFEPLKQLGNKIAMLQGAFTSLERIFGVLDTQEFVEGAAPCTRKLQGTVQFKDVTFYYKKNNSVHPVLHNVSFHMPAGQSLALVGPTGAGKSTITKLLSKLYDGYEGRITVDGQDIRGIEGNSLRQKIAIVPQDITLFDGTIRFNIGMDNPAIAEQDIIQAAQAVGAHEFIMSLPGGYDYVLKEKGSNLSQGQQQLLVFARALAKNPAVIILDEATSSVDPESEKAIQNAIASLLHGRSVIVVAHRLSTIRKCDQILVVQKGRIVESGNHDSLMQQKSAYYGLHEALI